MQFYNFVNISTWLFIVIYLETLLDVISKWKRLRKPRNVARKGEIRTANKMQVYVHEE